jgi:hypothetical protein
MIARPLRVLAAIACLVLPAAALAVPAQAQSAGGVCAPARQYSAPRGLGMRWLVSPPVVVLGNAGDPRIQLVRDAVAFWNGELARLGSGFRIGAVSVAPPVQKVTAWLPSGAAAALAERTGQPEDTPAECNAYCGRIVVTLSDQNFTSYAKYLDHAGTVLVAIRGLQFDPLTRPNVARNVVVHQFGHAIGLRHNDNPRLLMCGRPASCRPALWESETPRLFPLGEAERQALAAKYPSDWRAGRTRPGPASDP